MCENSKNMNKKEHIKTLQTLKKQGHAFQIYICVKVSEFQVLYKHYHTVSR